jgi:SAM-dependent MidA family methyltransferase
MGIEMRAERLMVNATDEQRESIRFNLDRLISGDKMGSLFKVMAAVSESLAAPYPFGEP